MISGTFAEILKENRSSLNLKFAEARGIQPSLDGEVFSDLLRQEVTPIVDTMDRHQPMATKQVALVLYDLTLKLLSKDFIGPNSRFPVILQGWRELLPRIPQHLSADPRTVIGAITNALYNFSLEPSARHQEWLEIMRQLAPLDVDAKVFLQAGQVAAWRAGFSHFREGALNLCLNLPRPVLNIALGLPDTSASLSMEDIVKRLAADPWLHPSSLGNTADSPRRLEIVKRAGAFRGFGGLFRQPPLVMSAGDHFIVRDGDASWLLVPDIFGVTFHRVDDEPEKALPSPFKIDQRGRVTCNNQAASFPELADHTSMVANAHTLAVTSSLSFSIFLIALSA